MSNVIAFPDTRPISEPPASVFDEAHIRAYAVRYAKQQPERITDMNIRLRLAVQAAELLHVLIEGIKADLDA